MSKVLTAGADARILTRDGREPVLQVLVEVGRPTRVRHLPPGLYTAVDTTDVELDFEVTPFTEDVVLPSTDYNPAAEKPAETPKKKAAAKKKPAAKKPAAKKAPAKKKG